MAEDGAPVMTASNRASTPLARTNLGADVYRVLWERLLNRELQPGAKLSDLRLSAELGVSRTPVREALNRLVQDGVVRAQPNRGFFVASFEPSDIAEVFDLRAALEGFALRTAAPGFDHQELDRAAGELDEVTHLIAAAQSAAERLAATARFLEVDQNFHRRLVERAGNSRLQAIFHGLWAQIAVFQQAGAHVPGWMELAIAQHREIIRLLVADDVFEAANALEAHILDMKARVLADLAPAFDATDHPGVEHMEQER